jgi:predicted DNA-binding protein YlxM (UPF0122 family)
MSILKKYLESALDDLNNLINLTKSDIEDIKLAKHESLFHRIEKKEQLIATFENKKKMIDKEIHKAVEKNPKVNLDSILDKIEKQYLEDLKIKLLDLKAVNRRYARLVVSVGTFYSSLLERVIPTEMEGYETVVKQSASFLEIKG